MAKDWTQDETIKQLEIEIEQKDAEIERLRKALKQFCDSYQPHLSPERCQHCSEAYWEARAALKEGE